MISVTGLNLVLYIEAYEYLSGFTASSGAVITIHPFKTRSFPESTGILVPPGSETNIGLKMV